MTSVAYEIGDWQMLDDAAFAKNSDFAGHLARKIQIMQDPQTAESALLLQAKKQAGQLCPRNEIDAGHRFIQNHHAGKGS